MNAGLEPRCSKKKCILFTLCTGWPVSGPGYVRFPVKIHFLISPELIQVVFKRIYRSWIDDPLRQAIPNVNYPIWEVIFFKSYLTWDLYSLWLCPRVNRYDAGTNLIEVDVSYKPFRILNTSIISPLRRRNFRVGKFRIFNLSS